MKQYTTPEQTAKLIELGFAEPKGHFCKVVRGDTPLQDRFTFDCNYSIGELIEIASVATITIENEGGSWIVSSACYDVVRPELIDCLFLFCVQLKEEGVI